MEASSRNQTGLGPLESRIMEIVWNAGEATVSAVVRELGKQSPAYTTVMTVMARLTDKGLLTRSLIGKAHVYRPTRSRPEHLQHLSEEAVRRVLKEHGQLAVAHFVQEMEQLDPEQLRQLAEFLKTRESVEDSPGA